MNPASITVNNAAGSDYVFVSDGAGKIAQGTLTKRGEGKLVLNLDNTGWDGDISVQQGELVAQVANSLGSGAITVTDGMLTLATAEVQPNGMINLQGGSLNLASRLFCHGVYCRQHGMDGRFHDTGRGGGRHRRQGSGQWKKRGTGGRFRTDGQRG
ncbi:MAG: hypothetical protein ACLT8C_01455 [Akkermansia muciniphila]